MSKEYEYDIPREVTEVSDETRMPETDRPVFVPREPDPSAWPVDEVRFTVTRGEDLFIRVVACFMAVILLLSVIFFAATAKGWTSPSDKDPEQGVSDDQDNDGQGTNSFGSDVKVPNLSLGTFADGAQGKVLYADVSDVKTIDLTSTTVSHAALAKVSDGKIVAGNGVDQRVYPASLTKVMTLIVAVEYLQNEGSLQEIISISEDIVVAMKAEGASGMGIEQGEKLTVEALLYALMLKSDGVAACELARYIAGTEEAFVALMNKKAQSMGLTGTHFTNPTGLHNENHYSTCRDLATMMGYAMNMSLCSKIMTEDAFDALCTLPNGSTFEYHIYHNLLNRYFNDYEELNPATAGGMTVLTGKTGYTPESQYCLATCARASDGSYYVCVTVGADSYESSIKAYQAIYGGYAG